MIKKIGACNEARTRDLDLGKVALYQLSYTRIYCFYYLTWQSNNFYLLAESEDLATITSQQVLQMNFEA
jgi:hypothetical protein